MGGPAPADEHGENHDEQNDQGQQHVPHGDFLIVLHNDGVLGLHLLLGQTLQSQLLGASHGAEVLLAQGDDRNQDQRQDRVELIGNGLHEGARVGALDAYCLILGGDDVHDIHAPAGDGDQNADRRGGGVQNVGQLGTGDLQLVEHGAEDGPQDQAVAGVGEIDGQTAQPAGELCADGLCQLIGDGPGKGACAAGFFYQCHKAADDGHQDNGLGVAAAGHIHEQIVTERGLQRCPGVAVGQDQAAAEQTDEQRQDDVLGQKGQGHREDRGDQGPDTEVNIHVIVSPFDIGLQPAAAGVAVCFTPCAVNLPSPYFSSKFRARMRCRVCWIFDKAFVRFAEKYGRSPWRGAAKWCTGGLD